MLDRLKNSDTFHLIRYVENDHDLNDLIIAGKARVGIKIPVDYSDRLLHNMSAQVLVLIDGSDSSVAGQAINVTTAIGLDESLRRVLAGSQRTFAVDMRPKASLQSGLPLAQFFLARPHCDSAPQRHHVSDCVLHRARERARHSGATLRHACAPVRSSARQTASLSGIGFFELCLILSSMRFIFPCPIHGSVLLLALLSLPYLFAALSLGILISSKASLAGRSHAACFSCLFFPASFFPAIFSRAKPCLPFLYPISYLIPATYFINITRGIILRGAGIHHLWTDGLALFIIGTLLLIIAARRFRNKVIMA